MAKHGMPCWFELATSDLEAAQVFYQNVLGWQTEAANMSEMDYRIASSAGTMVAGMMALDMQPSGTPPYWMAYFAVDDADAAARTNAAAGGVTYKAPETMPGVGRFGIMADPQGAVFGIIQEESPEGDGAWSQTAPGLGSWIELMTHDSKAALAAYGALFGWTAGQTMESPESGTYRLFDHAGATIGGMTGLGSSPVPNWLIYFAVPDVAAAISAVSTGGGKIAVGPMEVPGPALIAIAQDPQGAWFALIGPKP